MPQKSQNHTSTDDVRKFISKVAHELRSPLAVIKGAIDNLRDGLAGPLPQEADKMLQLANKNVNHLTKLISNLLEMSRLETGKINAEFTNIKIKPFIDNLLESLDILAKKNNIQIINDTLNNTEVLADPELLTEVFSNLFSNALRFSKSKITIQTKSIPNYHFKKRQKQNITNVLEIVIKDDGPGVPNNRIDDLFKKFVQVSTPERKSEYKGTGLGLVICQEIINLHHGEIWYENKDGVGAEFHFILPLPQ